MENNVNNENNFNEMPQPQNLVNNSENQVPVQPVPPIAAENIGFQPAEQVQPILVAQDVPASSATEVVQLVDVQQPLEPSAVQMQETTLEQQLVEVPGMPNPVPVVEAPGMETVETLGISSQSLMPDNKKTSSKKGLLILIGLILLALIIAVVVFLLLDKKDKEVPIDNPEQPVVEEDWDPTTSKIKISSGATKLVCTLEEPFDGMTNKVTYTHLYKDGMYVQVVVEDEIIFTEDTIQYYNYYVGSAEEEVEYEEQAYDNIVIEVRKKKDSVSLAYSFDLTASPENPKNMLDDKDITMDDMKIQMANLGFICE